MYRKIKGLKQHDMMKTMNKTNRSNWWWNNM